MEQLHSVRVRGRLGTSTFMAAQWQVATSMVGNQVVSSRGERRLSRQRCPVYQLGAREILDSDADGLEQGYFVGGLAAWPGAGDNFTDLGDDRARGDHVAGLSRSRLARFDIELGLAQNLVVELAPVGARCAYCI